MSTSVSSVFMRFPEGRAKALTFSYDDGLYLDRRLISLLDEQGMKGTFNVNCGMFAPEEGFREDWTGQRMTEAQIQETYADGRHEIAVHGYTHPFLDTLSPAAATREVMQDREKLEGMFGRIVRGMAYPYGTYTDATVEVLRACGIAYARTTHSTEGFDLPQDWLRLSATCHHINPRLMELAEKFVDMKVYHHAKLFYLWGHTYEFGDRNEWPLIEEFIRFMGGREDTVWYATNLEIYEYMQDFDRLVFSCDATLVHNPTNRKLWFALGSHRNVRSVEPGQTLKL